MRVGPEVPGPRFPLGRKPCGRGPFATPCLSRSGESSGAGRAEPATPGRSSPAPALVGPAAGNLDEFVHHLHRAEPDVLDFHLARGDFSRWISGVPQATPNRPCRVGRVGRRGRDFRHYRSAGDMTFEPDDSGGDRGGRHGAQQARGPGLELRASGPRRAHGAEPAAGAGFTLEVYDLFEVKTPRLRLPGQKRAVGAARVAEVLADARPHPVAAHARLPSRPLMPVRPGRPPVPLRRATPGRVPGLPVPRRTFHRAAGHVRRPRLRPGPGHRQRDHGLSAAARSVRAAPAPLEALGHDLERPGGTAGRPVGAPGRRSPSCHASRCRADRHPCGPTFWGCPPPHHADHHVTVGVPRGRRRKGGASCTPESCV